VDIDGAEMVRRHEASVAPRPKFRCGYGKLMSGDISRPTRRVTATS
jgi:hypothetical protein